MPSRPAPNRTLSLSERLRHARSREEQETLLQDCDDHADQYGLFYDIPGRMLNLNPFADLPVYTSIHRYVLIAFLVVLCACDCGWEKQQTAAQPLSHKFNIKEYCQESLATVFDTVLIDHLDRESLLMLDAGSAGLSWPASVCRNENTTA